MPPTYAVADLHGRLDLLDGALAAFPGIHLLIMGDVIDRGPHSLGCVRRLLELEAAGAVTLLWGNHEHMAFGGLQRYRTYQETHARSDYEAAQAHFHWWMGNGGSSLFREAGAFGVENYPPELLLYFERLHLAVYVDEAGVHTNQPPNPCLLATHAAPPKEHPDYPDAETASLWMRPHDGPFPLPPGVVWSVHGHTPIRAPMRLGQQVYTDLGAVMTGRLCLTRLDVNGPGEIVVLQGEGNMRLKHSLPEHGEELPYTLFPVGNER